MTDVVARRPAVEFGIPEVLVVLERRRCSTPRGRHPAWLRSCRTCSSRPTSSGSRSAFAAMSAARCRPSSGCCRRSSRRARRVTGSGRTPVTLSNACVNCRCSGKVLAIGAEVANLSGHRAAQRMLHADHRLDRVGHLHVGVEHREDGPLASRVAQRDNSPCRRCTSAT